MSVVYVCVRDGVAAFLCIVFARVSAFVYGL